MPRPDAQGMDVGADAGAGVMLEHRPAELGVVDEQATVLDARLPVCSVSHDRGVLYPAPLFTATGRMPRRV